MYCYADTSFCNICFTSSRTKTVVAHLDGKIVILIVRYPKYSHKMNLEVHNDRNCVNVLHSNH